MALRIAAAIVQHLRQGELATSGEDQAFVGYGSSKRTHQLVGRSSNNYMHSSMLRHHIDIRHVFLSNGTCLYVYANYIIGHFNWQLVQFLKDQAANFPKIVAALMKMQEEDASEMGALELSNNNPECA